MNTIEVLKFFLPLPEVRETDQVIFVSQVNGNGFEAFVKREVKILKDNIGE
jgi:hypothetical protein